MKKQRIYLKNMGEKQWIWPDGTDFSQLGLSDTFKTL